jgi:hypothetical protein
MATYVQSDDDWTITVSGPGEERSAKALGIIAARDRADQLAEELTQQGKPRVVHLLNGSALDFTEAYMTAKLTRPEIAPLEIPPPGSSKQAPAEAETAPDEAETKEEKPSLSGKPLAKAVEPRKPSALGGKPAAVKQAADVVK